MDEPTLNRWAGRSAEDVLGEVLHSLRAPVATTVGSFNVLKSVEGLSVEQTQQVIDLGWRAASRVQDVIDAISQYMTEKQKDQ